MLNMQQRSKINDLNINEWAWVLIQWSPERPSLILIVKVSGEVHGHKPSMDQRDAEMIHFYLGWVPTLLLSPLS